jgi:cytochrome c oxidase subunit I
MSAHDLGIHLPPPSYWPIVVAFGVLMTFALFMTGTWWAPLFGGVIMAIGVINWAFEPQ